MKKLLILLLLALPLCAQTVHTFPALDTDNTFTGPNLFQLLQMYNRTVSQLSALSPKRNGLTELITDGSTTTDCTIGGGSNYVLCYYKTGDSTWHPYFSGLGALVSAEYLPPLFTTNCASPSTCEDIVFSPIAVSDSMVFGTPSTPTLGLPYPTNFSGAFNCEDYTSSLSSAVCPFNSAVSSGTSAVPHHLVACIQHDGGTVTDVSDTLGNTWAAISGVGEECWIAHNTGSGADTVTFTLSAPAAYAVSMYEEVGADAANPIDTKLGSGSGFDGTQTWTVTTTQPDGYTITYSGGGAGGSGYQVVTSTSTYTQDIQTTHYGGGGTGHSFISGVGWGQLASTGSQSITTYCTALSGGSCTNGGLLLAFKPSGAGIPTYPNFLYLKYKHLVAGGDFPSISSGNAGQTLVIDPTGTKIVLGSAPGSGTVTSVTGTANQIDSTGGATPVISLDAAITFPGSIAMGAHTADFGTATSLEVPSSAGCSASGTGQICYDTTAKNMHLRANSADSIAGVFPSAPTTGHCVDTVVSGGNVLLHDTGAACGTSAGSFSVNGSLISAPNVNDTTPAAATNGYNVKWQASGSSVSGYIPAYGTIKYGFAFQGAVGASATGLIQVAAASTLPANLTTPTTTCKCGTNPTSSFAITLKDGASTVGTITLDSSCAATLATTGGTTQALAVDDQLYAVAPGSADATAANISCLVRASRN